MKIMDKRSNFSGRKHNESKCLANETQKCLNVLSLTKEAKELKFKYIR